MQISSTSRTSSSGKRGFCARAGFTLVELLISIAIIGVVTSIVLVKYGSFDSTVLLKSLAYEIALSLREAQVYSVSVAKNSTSFDYPFGVTFSLNSPKQYTSFRYKHSTDYPVYDANDNGAIDSPAEDIRTFPISRTMEIQDLCVTTGAGEDCAINRLDISFRRPKFKGLFDADGGSYNTLAESEAIESATITVGSAAGIHQFVIEVTRLGQISVYKK